MSANDRQIGGDHYKKHGETGEQHWDRVHRLGLDYFQSAITKYVERWKDKGGIQDLQKALHYLEKYIELKTAEAANKHEVVEDVEAAGPLPCDHEYDLFVSRNHGASKTVEACVKCFQPRLYTTKEQK